MTKLEEIKRALLTKLFNRRVIGSYHLGLTTITRMGWKSNERGLVKEAVKELLKEDLLVWAKKSKKALTLNKGRIKQIAQFVNGRKPVTN